MLKKLRVSKIENDRQIENRTMTFEDDDFTFLAHTDKFRAMFSIKGVLEPQDSDKSELD